jgi:CubicO group peptidase (beta-lactamase class C family)
MALTSTAVGLLLEQDRLKLDDEIQTYVPGFPKKTVARHAAPVDGTCGRVRTDEGDEEPLSTRCERTIDGLKRFAETPLRFEPGTQYRYSTYGWILVSASIEAAAKEPFFDFMRTQIFEPLDMDDTKPDVETDPMPERATFYYPRFASDPRYGPELAREGDYSCFAGGGGFLSTASDLVRFGLAINTGSRCSPRRSRCYRRHSGWPRARRPVTAWAGTSRRFHSRAHKRGWSAMTANTSSAARHRS